MKICFLHETESISNKQFGYFLMIWTIVVRLTSYGGTELMKVISKISICVFFISKLGTFMSDSRYELNLC